MADAIEKDDVQTVKADDFEEYETNIETNIEVFDNLSIVMHYPETPNDQVDQTVLDYLNGKRSEFKKESYERIRKEDDVSVQELHIDYEVHYEDPDTYVVRFIETETSQGGRQETEETYLHFSKANGKRLFLSHFLEKDKMMDLLGTYASGQEEALTGEQMEDFIYEGDTLTVFPDDEKETRLKKKEQPYSFREKYRKRFVMEASMEEATLQETGESPVHVPVTKEVASRYPVVIMGGCTRKRQISSLIFWTSRGRRLCSTCPAHVQSIIPSR
ncbi:hypothetical protein U0355_02580 [Salimicrobium sp. PL1-032A]|uniref:hypothetical protein n=1 Tax=Salimicrobium sp. PL1-032A TaxID=3095364 RepID=UPI00326197F4